MNIIWIDRPEALERFCTTMAPGDSVGFDTESDHFFRYRPVVALIQIATRTEAALVDPHALSPRELEPLFEVLADPEIEKVLHSARNDISEIDRDFGAPIRNVFDTQVAARFLSYARCSLDWLLEELCGVEVEKRFQRFDWMRRPIPPAAQEYAAGDAAHLFPLRDRLRHELDASRWRRAYREQMEFLERTSGYTETPFDAERWRRLKGASGADASTRAALRELYQYRHELCDRVDRAAVHIFSNGALLHLARRRPSTLAELEDVRGVADDIVRTNGDEILAALERARQSEPPPARLPRRGNPRSREEELRAKKISTLRASLATRWEIPHEFILSPAAIDAIAARAPHSIDELREIDDVLPWQVDEIGPRILDALRRGATSNTASADGS